jgi:O-antigen/teichoic acid export membrane protein
MLKRDITVTFVGSVASAILSLGDAIIIARVLVPINQGLLGLALLIPTIAATFCTLGQEMVNATFAGLYKDKRSSLFQQSLLVTL